LQRHIFAVTPKTCWEKGGKIFRTDLREHILPGCPTDAGKVPVFDRRPGLRNLGVKKAAGVSNARRYSDSVGFCVWQSLHARGMPSR